MQHKIVQVDEKVPLLVSIPLSIQHMFAMFGASVLVPAIFGINPATILLMNGIGTLGYLIICKGKVPAYLGSSFAFIPPVLFILGIDKTLWAANYPMVLGGFIAAGFAMILISFCIKFLGDHWLTVVFPPAVTGPIIALIGLGLADTAAKMAGIVTNNGSYDTNTIIVSMITLTVATLGSVLLRGFFAIIPILIAIIIGYCSACVLGLVKFNMIATAPLLSLPTFYTPKFDLNATIVILSAVFIVVSEHIGHFMLTQHIVKRNLMKDPGLHRSLFGNGLFTMLSGMVGSVPNTTYGENISVMTITRVYSVWVIGGAAIISILVAFMGKLTALIQSIPEAVMGGVSLFLFGAIAAAGLRYMVEEKIDYSKTVNLVLSAIVLIIGISSTTLHIGNVELKGLALAILVGISLSTIFHLLRKLHLTTN